MWRIGPRQRADTPPTSRSCNQEQTPRKEYINEKPDQSGARSDRRATRLLDHLARCRAEPGRRIRRWGLLLRPADRRYRRDSAAPAATRPDQLRRKDKRHSAALAAQQRRAGASAGV